ncbi:SCO family protein [Psychromonas ossibalaenae]|uniref:SCO family protein n=1 Tax=Psychromonas ossibalaenae TaxID=444922 RepID=UPI00037822AA|nr:SCO family protein [Psychromonas ossibalaenae]
MKKRLLGIAVFICIVSFFGRGQADNLISKNPSLVLQDAGKTVPDFSFIMSADRTFTNKDLLNKWTLFFIGYTFCPDICPTTLADLDRIYPELIKAPYKNIQVVFVSVDPNRDKAEQLAEYVSYFNPNFKGTTSTHQKLFPFAQNLGLVYSIVDEGDTDQYYLVDHSASIVLINPRGEHHASFKARLNKDGIAHVNMDLMVQDIHHIYQQWQ